MDRSNLNNAHIAIVAPLPEDYETARALLGEPDPEHHLTSSGAACSLGKVGLHNVVLVGKAEDITNVSVFVKDTVDDLLEAFPSIRAGFLIGVDATAPEESLVKPGDIVVALPQGFQPGQVQFDVEETIMSNRISTAYEMSHPPSCITSVINTLQSAEGRQQWGQYLANQLHRCKVALGCDIELNRLDSSQPSRVLRGTIASSSRPLPDRDFINKIGGDSNIMCFERAAANLESSLPFLTICSIANSTDPTRFPNSVPSAKSQGRLATVIYAVFVLHRINPAQLQQEHAFIDLFHYEPFDLESAGFRLVVLEKGSQSQVQCRLYQSHLDDINFYEALSYAWEGQDKPHEIIVDGKYLSITASLNDALFHLRRPDEDRVLWIDALCINQNNIKERGHQVSRMGEIYKKAEKVVIWLGYLSGSSIMFQSAVHMFGRNLPSNAFREWPRDDNRWKDQWKLIEAYLGSSSHDELAEALQSLLGKPWFSRVWILQEVANAKRITVGYNLGEVPGKVFSLLPHAMDVKISEQTQAVLDIMPHRLRRSQNQNLCNLLWEFRGCKATDPRDRIYALLGMASDVENIEIRADYAKEEKVVVREFCSYLLGEGWTGNLPAPTIDELQVNLPSLSKELLLQKLKQGEPADSLKQFLNRQGLIPSVDGSDVLNITQYGSEITSLLLDRSRETVWIPREAALQCLRRHPHVFEVLLRRSDFKIEEMPMFIAQSMEYHPDFLERLLRSSSNPDQLRDAALVAAISLGLSSCRPLLTQCRDSINITKSMLRRAIFCYQESQDVLRYLLDVAQSPVQWSTNLFVEASPGNPRGIRIVDKHSRPVSITREVIEAGMGIRAGPEDLQLLFEHMEHPVELDEDLFLKAIAKGAGVVRCLLDRCNQPFNVTERVYARAYKAGVGVFEQILQNSLPDFKNTERNFEMDVKVGANHLRKRLKNLRGKLQITDKVIGVAEDDVTREMLLEMRDTEETVTEDAAIRAIETGPKAFNELYNKPGTNFKVTERILEAAAEQGYALHILEAGRSSEVKAARRALREKEKQTHPGDWLERLWRRP
ncbi:heterokaryon incompatibility protein [Fusarium circinatum]|uniref:Heterokaryon incompatibility protein n=1 Tax=Fusarium circinatum TaxID=48490 RepID=A0A8H5TEL7_FUSCI|nr:heterokaryon incompatibility protein [Fusarium circinatum]